MRALGPTKSKVETATTKTYFNGSKKITTVVKEVKMLFKWTANGRFARCSKIFEYVRDHSAQEGKMFQNSRQTRSCEEQTATLRRFSRSKDMLFICHSQYKNMPV